MRVQQLLSIPLQLLQAFLARIDDAQPLKEHTRLTHVGQYTHVEDAQTRVLEKRVHFAGAPEGRDVADRQCRPQAR